MVSDCFLIWGARGESETISTINTVVMAKIIQISTNGTKGVHILVKKNKSLTISSQVQFTEYKYFLQPPSLKPLLLHHQNL